MAALRQEAARRIHAGEDELGLVVSAGDGGPFKVVRSGSDRLVDAVGVAWRALGFDQVVHDRVFYQMVLARVVEPSSKLDALRVLDELGVATPSYGTVKNCLARTVARGYRGLLESACAKHVHLEQVRFCLYDVTTLYFETHEGDGFREPGFSKERRLEPQITVGLLTTGDGFPLRVAEFNGDTAETKTILPVLEAFRAANPGCELTVVADAGMMSWDNLGVLEDAKFTFVVGGRIPEEPGCVKLWRLTHPGEQLVDGQVFHQLRTGTKAKPRHWHVWFQYRAKRAKRDLVGIAKTVEKAQAAIQGGPVNKNRFLMIEGGRKRLNSDLVADAQARAGLRCYVTNLDTDPALVIDAYHQLWQIEKAFRMSKHDLEARPIYHWRRPSIEAHLTIVFAALAIGSWIEKTTGVTLRRFLEALRPIRAHTIKIADHEIKAEDPINQTAAGILQAIHTQGH